MTYKVKLPDLAALAFGDETTKPVPREDNPFNVVEAQVAAMLANNLAVEPVKISRSALLVQDLGADQLDLVELTMDLEDEFGMEISDAEAESLKTVEDVFVVVQKAIGHEADATVRPVAK